MSGEAEPESQRDDSAAAALALALPREQARSQLVAALANLMKRAGWERFVTQPIVLPSAKYFPDAWTCSERGAYRLTRRLLVYADLADGEVDLHAFRTTEGDTHRTARGESYAEGPEHAAATFHGITEKGYTFGIDVRNLDDGEVLVSSMSHEVAHAFREKHDLMVMTRDTEEQLTDLTTIYLGFGILTTNGAYRYRVKGGFTGSMVWQQSQHASLGYLSAGDMVFLLAVQVVARGAKGGLVRRVESHLEANQAGLFGTAVAELKSERQQLLLDLGLPPEETWPPPRELATFLAPLDLSGEDRYDDEPPKSVGVKDANLGVSVFRVRSRRFMTFSAAGAAVGAAIAGWLSRGGSIALALVATGAALGIAVGRTSVFYECSDPSCSKRLRREEEKCGRCGGLVRGTIGSESDRLNALEAYEEGTFVSLD